MFDHPQYCWWFDGERDCGILDLTEVQIPLGLFFYTHAMHYASAVFEGIRAYPASDDGGRNIFRLDDHLDRLWLSARNIGLWLTLEGERAPFTREQVRAACVGVLARNSGDSYLRPFLWRGTGIGVDPLPSKVNAAVITAPWGKYLSKGLHNDGVRVTLSDFSRIRPNQLPPGKAAAAYCTNQRVKADAILAGCSEALLFAPDSDHLAEGTGMNLVLVFGKTLATPDVSSARLPGITLQTVRELGNDLLGYTMEERPVLPAELLLADEAFFTGTATEITAITMVGDQEIGKTQPGRMGPVTTVIKNCYSGLVRGEMPGYHPEWLTSVPAQSPAPLNRAPVAVAEAV